MSPLSARNDAGHSSCRTFSVTISIICWLHMIDGSIFVQRIVVAASWAGSACGSCDSTRWAEPGGAVTWSNRPCTCASVSVSGRSRKCAKSSTGSRSACSFLARLASSSNAASLLCALSLQTHSHPTVTQCTGRVTSFVSPGETSTFMVKKRKTPSVGVFIKMFIWFRRK